MDKEQENTAQENTANELSDDELEAVAGGGTATPLPKSYSSRANPIQMSTLITPNLQPPNTLTPSRYNS